MTQDEEQQLDAIARETFTPAEVGVLMMRAWTVGVMRARGTTHLHLDEMVGDQTAYEGRRADVQRVLREFEAEHRRG